MNHGSRGLLLHVALGPRGRQHSSEMRTCQTSALIGFDLVHACYKFTVASLLIAGSLGFVYAADSEGVTQTTLCALYESPSQYAGKFVQLRARVIGHNVNDLWIEDVSVCSTPTAYMFMLAEDALPRHVALMATLEGRFDPVFVWKDKKQVRVGEGDRFGKKHRYDGRIVVRKITSVKTIFLAYR